MKDLMKRALRSRPFLIGMFILGFLILIYPLISNWYYRVEQDEVVSSYVKNVSGMEEEERRRLLSLAHAYNEGLARAGVDIFSPERMSFIQETIRKETFPVFFLESKTIGRIRIPKIKVDLPITMGTTDDILERGAGLMPTGSLPVGGTNTHAVITAHRGLPSSRLFRDLGELKEGDVFLLDVLGEKLAYEVDQISIIEPDDPAKLAIIPGEDMVSLLTCHPYMINSQRLVVRGHETEPYEEGEQKALEQGRDGRLRLFFVQYWEYIAGIGIFLALVGAIVLHDRRKRKRALKKKMMARFGEETEDDGSEES